ncbi:scavenger receptor class F member 1-like [Liolophura sinensis]|uniref:scavenger receptor class F member 1-like n=1 Tax=Liolophura sinensis TaxID=3198878 RepID=UPI0031596325
MDKTFACSSYKWGSDCEETCGQCHDGAVCDLVSGECPTGNPRCATGHIGPRCTPCDPGTWGNNCVLTCSENCVKLTCNVTTGVCDGGCNSGYTGGRCGTVRTVSSSPVTLPLVSVMEDVILVTQGGVVGQVTYPGSRGNNCVLTCSENCVKLTCNVTTGVCDGGCNSGYTGGRCGTVRTVSSSPVTLLLVYVMEDVILVTQEGAVGQVTYPGSRGNNCALTCIESCVKLTCNVTTGVCDGGCNSGYTGGRCGTGNIPRVTGK